MFLKKILKNKFVVNEIFGTMEKNELYWMSDVNTKTKIFFWNKIYEINIKAIADTEEDINSSQENAYQKLEKIVVERKNEIEKVVEWHFDTDDERIASSRFIPTDFIFDRNGNCALYVCDAEEEFGVCDDYDEGFALGIIPEIEVYSKEEYDMYLFGGGDFPTKEITLISNGAFGEMLGYDCYWTVNVLGKISLWNKMYRINVRAAADTVKEKINSNQEYAYEQYKEIIVKKKQEIEAIIEKHFNISDEQKASSRFIPTTVLFSRDGACVLYAENNEDFVLGILPKSEVYSKEDYDMYLYGGGGFPTPIVINDEG
jgi:hypothetical protein